jgi:RNA polymerase sigma factor (sigma-70 family)
MTPDSELLRQFARTNSEAAFAELVKRHVNLVYSAALRQVGGDEHFAKDVAQTVFADLARKAGALSRREGLIGWLYTSAHFAAAKIVRTENRRRDREEKFMREPNHENTPGADWEKIRLTLDDAMHELKETDREAILLRYFENQPFIQVGAKLGLNENAARMRVERALEKLRAIFAKRGITTAAALASVISANAVQIAPANLAAMLTAGSIAAAGTGTFTLLKIMTATKLKLGISALVVAGAATTFVVQHQAQEKLRAENESLTQQIAQLQSDNESLSKRVARVKPAPHLPAPQMQMTAPVAALPAEELPSTNLYARLKDKNPKLTPEQVEAYLKANGRTAASLLAAFRTSGDPALLQEAMRKYPNDPQVAFEAVFDKDLSPAEQRQWLNRFEQTAPNNALANYLSALNYFKTGQIDQGVQELTAASGKSLDDYTIGRMENDEEAYLAAGYSMADANELALWQIMLPQLAQLKQLGSDAVDLANAYSQAGDTTSAQAVLQMALNLGQQYANPAPSNPEISQLVGIAIERNALQAMDPNGSYGNSGQTVQDRLNELAQQQAAIHELGQQAGDLFPAMSDQDWIIYKDRFAAFGGVAADQWVINKYGQQ